MYARGMSTREIQGHLEEIYQVEVSPTLISHVTEEVPRICSRFIAPAQWNKPGSGSMSSPQNADETYPTISQLWRRNWEHLTHALSATSILCGAFPSSLD